MIYIFGSVELITEEIINEFLPRLPAERRNKALRYRQLLDRNLCVLGYLLLCSGLRAEYGITEYPRLTYNEYGNPYLSDYPDIYFNISHCILTREINDGSTSGQNEGKRNMFTAAYGQ